MHCLTVEVGGLAIFVIVRTCVRVVLAALPSEPSRICQVLHAPVCASAFVSEPLLFRPLPCPPVLCHVYPVFVSTLHDEMVYVFLPSCFACSVSSVWSAPQCPAPICPHSAPPYCVVLLPACVLRHHHRPACASTSRSMRLLASTWIHIHTHKYIHIYIYI